MSNPTTGNESQFKAPFNILPDLKLLNPTRTTTSQFNAPFDILPNARLSNPTRIITTQFNSDLGENSWSSTNNINDLATQFFSLNPTQKTNTVSQFSRPDQFSQKDSEENLRLTTRAFPMESSNIIGDTLARKGINLAGSIIGGTTGLTTVTAGTFSLATGTVGLTTPYNTLPMDSLRNTPGVKYQDFRTKLRIANEADTDQQVLQSIAAISVNGASAATRLTRTFPSNRARAYAVTSLAPGGAYSVFNIKQTYGYGEHDAPSALRKDFTARSLVNKTWDYNKGDFVATKRAIEVATPFRGDKVNVIDFGKRTLLEAYRWKPSREDVLGADLGNIADTLGINKLDVTQDFIKFYFTGPAIQPGGNQKDDIIAFRATITNMDDSFSADWNSVQMVGRADPNYHYSSFSRGGSLTFEVYATDRDELKPIYRKLNALASYTAPIYDMDTIAMKGPWMRLTVGDIHNQQPIVLTSVTYTYGFDASWEINIEDDKEMMQVPMKVSVNCQFNIVANDIPQNNGRMLSLARRYDSGSKGIKGDDNWLSDFKENVPDPDPPTDTQRSGRNNSEQNQLSEEQFTQISTAGQIIFNQT